MVIKSLGISTTLTLLVLTLSVDFVTLIDFTHDMWVDLFKVGLGVLSVLWLSVWILSD